MRALPGSNAAEFTASVSPRSITRLWPLTASQIRAVLSSEAVTIRLPSGLNEAVFAADSSIIGF
jgi:hypothetical protein